MNWKKIIKDLTSVGVTQCFLAKKLGLSQPTVAKFASGKLAEMKYTPGVKLIEYHAKVFGKKKCD